MAQINLPENTTTTTTKEVPKLQSIVDKDEVKVQKPGVEKKLRNIFISEDANSVGDYIVWKVIVPAVQGMLRDAGHGIVDTVFGRGGSKRGYSGGYYGERRSYEGSSSYRYSNYSSNYYDRRDARSYRDNYAYDSRDSEIIFRSRAKAEECRDTLFEIIDRQGFATINQLSDLIGIDDRDRPRKDDEWGWYSIRDSRIRPIREGFLLELPRPEPIR